MKILDGVVLISPKSVEKFMRRHHIESKHEVGFGVRLQMAQIALSGVEAESNSDSFSCMRAMETVMIEPMITVNKMMKKT